MRRNIDRVIEDPLTKDSKASMLIQQCGVSSYFLKQTMEPNSFVRKHRIHGLFYKLDPVLLKDACKSDPHGVVRLQETRRATEEEQEAFFLLGGSSWSGLL